MPSAKILRLSPRFVLIPVLLSLPLALLCAPRPVDAAHAERTIVFECEGEQLITWLGAAGAGRTLTALFDGRRLTISEIGAHSAEPVLTIDAPQLGAIRGIVAHPGGWWIGTPDGLWFVGNGGELTRCVAANCRFIYRSGSLAYPTTWADTITGVGGMLPLDDGSFYALLEGEALAEQVHTVLDAGPAALAFVERRDDGLFVDAILAAYMTQAMALRHDTLWLVDRYLRMGGCVVGAPLLRKVNQLPVTAGDEWWRGPEGVARVRVNGGARDIFALAIDPEGYPWVGLYDPEKRINTVYWWDVEKGWMEDVQLAALLGDERATSVIAATREMVYLCGSNGTLYVGHGDAWERVPYRADSDLGPVRGLGRAARDGSDLLITDGRVLYRLQSVAD